MGKSTTIHTSTLFDSKAKGFVSDVSIVIDVLSGTITRVYQRTQSLPATIPPEHVDLRGKYVMPGFVDAHSHVFLHPYKEAPSLNQMRDESIVERTVRAVNHCRAALLSGYTTYRDLGTEGMGDHDARLRDAINRGLIPGPRLFVATEALASSGSYATRVENYQGGLGVARASDVCDGVDGARAAVRRRMGAGADLIKFYADYRRRTLRCPPPLYPGGLPILHPPVEPNPESALFAQDEVDAIVKEARRANAPVAAHAQSIEGASMAIRAGVTTIEHGVHGNEALFKLMVDHSTIFVPTLAVFELYLDSEGILAFQARVKQAHDLGVRLACGGDTGTFAHGQGAREMELMIKAGIRLEHVLESCTIGGFEACGGEMTGMRFGWLEAGCRADIIALKEDPRTCKTALRTVDFVMKDGHVWKMDGKAVGMGTDETSWDDRPY